MTTQDHLAIRDLNKSFGGQQVLDGLCLDVPSGSVTAVLGASGSGKTTLLRIIAGFERADRGTVEIGETRLNDDKTHLPPAQRRIGYVAQEGNLFPHLNVMQNVGFGLPRRERRGSRVTSLLEAVGLSGLNHRYPHQLSGGQQQRVALARSLAVGSRAVLFDEPFNTLDASLRASVRVDVHRIVREAGATVMLVTHDQDEALLMADHVAVIRNGMIAQVATPTELYARPVDPELACFVGEANLLHGTWDGPFVSTPFGRHRVRNTEAGSSGTALVMIRPEEIGVSGDLEGPGLRGQVVEIDFHGPQRTLRIILEDRVIDRPVVVRLLGASDIGMSSKVRLTVEGSVCAWPVDAVPMPLPGADKAREVDMQRGKES